jgi:cytochrome b pre-mRNA-processing protein 3
MALSDLWSFTGRAQKAAARVGHGEIVRAALRPELYKEFGVPDTFDGRAGAVTLMLALVCARLALVGGRDAAGLTRRLNDLVLDGFDAAYRETGVGDHSIARKVRTLAEAHSGLGRALMPALASGNLNAVHTVLARNGLAPANNTALATHALAVQAQISGQTDTAVLAGDFSLAA